MTIAIIALATIGIVGGWGGVILVGRRQSSGSAFRNEYEDAAEIAVARDVDVIFGTRRFQRGAYYVEVRDGFVGIQLNKGGGMLLRYVYPEWLIPFRNIESTNMIQTKFMWDLRTPREGLEITFRDSSSRRQTLVIGANELTALRAALEHPLSNS